MWLLEDIAHGQLLETCQSTMPSTEDVVDDADDGGSVAVQEGWWKHALALPKMLKDASAIRSFVPLTPKRLLVFDRKHESLVPISLPLSENVGWWLACLRITQIGVLCRQPNQGRPDEAGDRTALSGPARHFDDSMVVIRPTLVSSMQ